MFLLNDEQTWNEAQKEVVIPYWGMSPREMFQKVGTEAGRNIFGEDLWLKRWRYHYAQYGSISNYVVPDVRFENEAKYIRDLGGVIFHVTRQIVEPVLLGNTATHSSEAGVKFVDGDRTLTNYGTKTVLCLVVDEICEEIGVNNG